jgi:hypothetical protein
VQRPNRIAGPNDFAGRSASEWFNAAAFTAAGQFTIGNSSRNPIRGPGLQNADIMLGKVFRMSERGESTRFRIRRKAAFLTIERRISQRR